MPPHGNNTRRLRQTKGSGSDSESKGLSTERSNRSNMSFESVDDVSESESMSTLEGESASTRSASKSFASSFGVVEDADPSCDHWALSASSLSTTDSRCAWNVSEAWLRPGALVCMSDAETDFKRVAETYIGQRIC